MNQDRLEALALEVQQKDTEIRRLSAQVGNLEFQNAEYSQIVKELSDRLKLYEEINGSVFRPARK
jgi:cell division protein FtsL